MNTVGCDSDFRAHAELSPVGELCRRIVQNDGAVRAVEESGRGVLIVRNDTLGMSRPVTFDMRHCSVDAFDDAHAAGLETMALAMVNAPGEGWDGVRATWRLIRRLDPDQLQVSICTPYPGTRLYDEARQDGTLRTDDWARYRFLRSAVFDNGVLSEEEALQAQRMLQLRFWARPRIVARLARRVLTEPRARRAVLGTATAGARRLLSGSG